MGAPAPFTSRNSRTKRSRALFTRKYFNSAKIAASPIGTSSRWAARTEKDSMCREKRLRNSTSSANEKDISPGPDVSLVRADICTATKHLLDLEKEIKLLPYAVQALAVRASR